MKDNEKGRSMIEMLGVLAIVGVLSIGGIAGYSKAMGKVKNNRLVTEISELIMNVRTMYFGHATYSNINGDLLINAGVVPHGMIKTATNTIMHAYGGDVKVFTSNVEGGFPRAFELYFTDLDTNTCIVMLTTEWGQDVSSGFQGLYVGNDEITAPLMLNIYIPYRSTPEVGIYTPGIHEHSVPLSISDAVGACTCDVVKCAVGLKYT